MYRIAYNGEMVFDLYADHEIVTDTHLSGKTNAADYLDFTVMLDNPIYSKFKERQGTVEAWQDSELIFRGKIETIELDTQGNKAISCVSEFDNLNDVHIRPYSFNAGEAELQCPTELDEYFAWLIQQHNKYAVGSSQDFELGVNQAGSFNNNSAYGFKNDSKPTTASEITDKIIDRWGGYLMLHYEGDRPYIDFYSDVHDMNTQVIDFGVNITSFTKKTETKDQYTAIYPVGGTPQATDTDKNPKQVTIKTISSSMASLGYDDDVVHDPGSDYIYLASAVAKYGYHEQTYSDDTALTDITLLKSAVTELKKDQDPTITITVKAVDLSLYMDNYEKLRVGQAVRIRSKLHDEDEYLMVESIDLDLNNPEQSEYTLGASYDTLTGQQSGYLKKLNASINSAVDTVSSLDEETKAQSIRLGATEIVANDAKNTAGKAVTVASTAQDTADGAVKENTKQATRISTLEAFSVSQVDQNAIFQAAIEAAKSAMDDAQGNLNDAIDQMEQNRQEAAEATQGVRDDLAKTEDSMNAYITSNDKALHDAVKSIATVSTAADTAQKAADKVAGDLKATDVKVTQNTTDLGGLQMTMTTVKGTADTALGLSTQHTQDIKGINDTLTYKYITKDETLIKVAEVQKTADAISTKLTSDYTTTANADAKYSTKSELNQSAAGIRSDVSKTYATKDSVTSQVSAVQQSADAIALNLSTNYQNSSDIAKTYATQAALKATSDSITSEVSKTYATKATTDALQNIADNAVETFMGSAVPTTSNAPAKDWNTDALRKQHSGDIYYSTTDGKSYRYGNPDSQGWQWTLIQDSDITKAIQDAAKAQTTANTANSGVQKLNTDIPLTYATKSNLNQTASDISASVASTYATQKSLTDAQAAIKLTTDGITADISKNYQTMANADGKYSTKTSLQATDDKIATSISAQASKDDAKYSTKSELTQKSDELSGRITETASTAAGNLTTTKNEFQAKVDSINTTLSQTNELVGYASFPNELDKNRPNQWYCAIYPIPSKPADMSNGSYDSFAGLTARYTNYAADGNGALLNYVIDYSWYIARTLVSFDSDTRWQFTCKHDDSCRMLVDSETVYYCPVYKTVTDTITIDFKAGLHTFDVLVGNATGGAGINNFSVPLSTIATTMYAPASQSELSKDATALTNRVTTAEQSLGRFKNTVEETYTTKDNFNASEANGQELVLNGTPTAANPALHSRDNSLHYNTTDNVWERVFPGGETHHDFIMDGVQQGTLTKAETFRCAMDVRLTNGTWADTDYFVWGLTYGWRAFNITGLTSTWQTFSKDIIVPVNSNTNSNDGTLYYASSYASSEGAKTVQFRNISVRRITDAVDTAATATNTLANQVAQTYTTKSEFTQTTDKIQSQVLQSLGAVSGGNMVYNPGFELGQTENSTTTNWSWGGDGVTGRIETSNTNPIHSGSYRFYASLPSAKNVWVNSQSSMSLMQGHTYKVSAWVCLDTKGTIDLGIETNVPSTLGDYDHAVQVNAVGGWTEVSTYITATRDYAKAHVYLRFEQSKIGGNVRLDDVSCVDASDYSELSSRVTQTAQQWGVQLNQVSTATDNAIADVNEALDNQSNALTATSDKIDDEISQRQAYMNFTQDESGNPLLELGASQNTNKVDITNEKVSFKSEGSEVAYISNKELHINNATIVQKLIIGNKIGFIPRADGHLTLTRI